MAKKIQKTTKPATATQPMSAPDAASRLKHELISNAIDRFGRDNAKPTPSGLAHVLLVLANHGEPLIWDKWKTRQREIFEAAGPNLGMKLGVFGRDDAQGVRRCCISSNWQDNADAMDGHMDRAQAQCACGCFVYVRAMAQQAVKENAKQPMRAVIIDGDMFHDDQEDLDEAAIAFNELERAGTQVFLIQQGDNPDTARRLKYLARVTGAAYFKFGAQQHQLYAELLPVLGTYVAGGEAAVQAKGGQAATLLLEGIREKPMQRIQDPMPIVEAREPVRVHRDIKE